MTTNFIQRRFNQVLGSFRQGAVRTDSDALRELAELCQALEDAPVRPDVIARLTLTRQDNTKVIVEVHRGARYAIFYHVFMQQGNKRSTKRQVRIGSRAEGRNLEEIAIKWSVRDLLNNPITSARIKIYYKREYRRLVSARPDELGLTKTSPLPIYHPVARHS
jgi:hypothetical protein